MKQVRERKKRVYTSMFDPFREDIEKWCDQGMTLQQAYNMLPAGYSFGGFYSYLRAKGIRGCSWNREIDIRNKCAHCEYCHEFKNAKGFVNRQEHLICTKTWRVIGASVRHCPRWCELYMQKIEELHNEQK